MTIFFLSQLFLSLFSSLAPRWEEKKKKDGAENSKKGFMKIAYVENNIIYTVQ